MSWSRSSSHSGRRGFQPSAISNDWLVVSSLKASANPNSNQTVTGRPRSASVHPRVSWTKRPESAMSIRSFERTQQARTTAGLKVKDSVPNDGIVVTFDSDLADCPIVYRKTEVREANPERINLDRRNFSSCPILRDEMRLRLLNLENNAIKEISNLSCLPNLIFLDLYNNQISEISGLDALPSLRVLMLGKNLIKHVQNLSVLQKLDVLDLHSNLIESISGIEALSDLRVLNLASNSIVDVNNLSKLSSLTELNLRRNLISQIDEEILTLTALSRLFLSHNKISDLTSIQSIAQLQSLSELSLDGNPVADEFNPDYRSSILEQFSVLKVLDGRRVTSEERRLIKAINLFSSGSEGVLSARTSRDSLKNIKSTRLSNCISVDGKKFDLVDAVRSTWKRRSFSSSKSEDMPSFHEFLSKKGHLSIYGPCLDVLVAGRFVNIVWISFHYVDFNKCSSYFVSLRDSAHLLRKLSFRDNDLHTFYQLDTLSVFSDLDEIELTDNPITEKLPMFRAYLIFRMPTIQIVNSVAVESQERDLALAMFHPLKMLWNTSSIRRIKGFCQPLMAMPLGQSLADMAPFCQQITSINQERPGSCLSVQSLVSQTIRSIENCKFVDRHWSEITIRLSFT